MPYLHKYEIRPTALLEKSFDDRFKDGRVEDLTSKKEANRGTPTASLVGTAATNLTDVPPVSKGLEIAPQPPTPTPLPPSLQHRLQVAAVRPPAWRLSIIFSGRPAPGTSTLRVRVGPGARLRTPFSLRRVALHT